jgi:hypothetical protein
MGYVLMICPAGDASPSSPADAHIPFGNPSKGTTGGKVVEVLAFPVGAKEEKR